MLARFWAKTFLIYKSVPDLFKKYFDLLESNSWVFDDSKLYFRMTYCLN